MNHKTIITQDMAGGFLGSKRMLDGLGSLRFPRPKFLAQVLRWLPENKSYGFYCIVLRHG